MGIYSFKCSREGINYRPFILWWSIVFFILMQKEQKLAYLDKCNMLERRIMRHIGSSLPPVVCRWVHVLFVLFVFVYMWFCPAHIVLSFCLFFLRLCYQFLWIVLSVFSNVYIVYVIPRPVLLYSSLLVTNYGRRHHND